MANYMVVLFKDKKKKKIINKFITLEKAKSFFEKQISKSKEVIFDVRIESGKECSFELGLIQNISKNDVPIYMVDEFGRNVKVKLAEDGMTLLMVSPFRKEEKIFDLKQNRKISINELIKSYLKGDGIKMISAINNKILIQEDNNFNLFSLKSEHESIRFIDSLSSHFLRIRRSDCIFVKDFSKPQRKYLYDLLEKNGFEKKILYRKFTTLPRSK